MSEYQDAAFRIVNPASMHDPSSLGYSQVAIIEPGARTVYVAGQAGGVDKRDFADQVRVALDGIERAMRAAGGGMADVVKLTVYVVAHDRVKHRALIKAIGQAFGDRLAPTCTIVPLERLGTSPEMLVEIEATGAVVP